MTRPSAMQPRLTTSLAAGALVGIAVGVFVGLYLVLANPVAGFTVRLTVIVIAAVAYTVLLTLPMAGVLLVCSAIARRSARGMPVESESIGRLWQIGIALIVGLVCARRAFDVAKSLSGGDGLALATALDLLAPVVVGIGGAQLVRALTSAATRRVGGRVAAAAVALMIAGSAVTVSALPTSMMLRGEPSSPSGIPSAPVEAVTSSSPARRVALLGFDGVDVHILDALIRAGELPHFAQLRKDSAYSQYSTLSVGLSPLIWTTIVTGVRPGVHGIHDFFGRFLAGTSVDVAAMHHFPSGFFVRTLATRLIASPAVDERPITPGQRRTAALWNLATMAGLKSCVFDWMGTWPAERIDGVMISDRAFFWWNEGKLAHVTADVEDAGLPLRYLSKEALAPADSPKVCTPEPECMQLIPAKDPQNKVDVQDGPAFHLAENAFHRGVAQRVLAAQNCDLIAYYDHLPDFVNHVLKPNELIALRQGDLSSKGAQLARTFYADADATLGLLLESLPPDTLVFVMSDHGVELETKDGVERVGHDLGPPGILFVRPSAGRSAPQLGGYTTIYDLAPTSMALLGLPVPSYVEGHVLDAVVKNELGEHATLRSIDVPPNAFVSASSAETGLTDRGIEDSSRERLRALGYVE